MRTSEEVSGEITAEKLIETDNLGRDKTTKKQIGGDEVLNLALYDQADPNNLFLAEIDKAKF